MPSRFVHFYQQAALTSQLTLFAQSLVYHNIFTSGVTHHIYLSTTNLASQDRQTDISIRLRISPRSAGCHNRFCYTYVKTLFSKPRRTFSLMYTAGSSGQASIKLFYEQIPQVLTTFLVLRQLEPSV
ncbi:hypothetical protein PoB_006331700 [Plakobranchus ocellatus]|uniref:Uncharacterized protein n=1 Tax=Plakobranchus ocellatus TaxID=259542 RepID=A0AAV4CY30_9GAST|nr:hypothetical protein PoB_006331700 [Plakobranchus ocellatus]